MSISLDYKQKVEITRNIRYTNGEQKIITLTLKDDKDTFENMYNELNKFMDIIIFNETKEPRQPKRDEVLKPGEETEEPAAEDRITQKQINYIMLLCKQKNREPPKGMSKWNKAEGHAFIDGLVKE